jgi:hypothetical protein
VVGLALGLLCGSLVIWVYLIVRSDELDSTHGPLESLILRRKAARPPVDETTEIVEPMPDGVGDEALRERNRVLEAAWLDFVTKRSALYHSPTAFYQAMLDVEARHDDASVIILPPATHTEQSGR